MSEQFEKRFAGAAELRAGASGVVVSGYAAVFNQWTDIAGYWDERIAPGAFSASLGRDDVVFLVNHEGLPLARTRSGTLKLAEDSHGLKVDSTLDAEDPDVQAIVPKMKRGDLDKMSFAFIATRSEWDENGPKPRRTILEASLHDVSIVTTPAYDGTEIGLRALQAHRSAAAPVLLTEAERIALRLRMKHGIFARRA